MSEAPPSSPTHGRSGRLENSPPFGQPSAKHWAFSWGDSKGKYTRVLRQWYNPSDTAGQPSTRSPHTVPRHLKKSHTHAHTHACAHTYRLLSWARLGSNRRPGSSAKETKYFLWKNKVQYRSLFPAFTFPHTSTIPNLLQECEEHIPKAFSYKHFSSLTWDVATKNVTSVFLSN